MEEKPILRYLTSITSFISIISAIVYITFYIGTMDKRISVIENQYGDAMARIMMLKDDVATVNNLQNEQVQQFHEDMGIQFEQMNQSIDKIYSVIIENRKRHAVN